ncbi:amino acid-binding protein [Actinomycetota bacterium]|nr:amino acid-binding protein [Actinomycetota bacterium]
MIKQLTVFLENDQGHLAAVTKTLADAGISLTALTVADTTDFGVARILVSEPEKAQAVLTDAGYRSRLIDVYAVEVPNVAGGLAKLLTAFDEAGINLEYAYCFASTPEAAVDVFRVEQSDRVQAIVEDIGFKLLTTDSLYK